MFVEWPLFVLFVRTRSFWTFPLTQTMILKEKFGLFVDFEFVTEMGSWGTD